MGRDPPLMNPIHHLVPPPDLTDEARVLSRVFCFQLAGDGVVSAHLVPPPDLTNEARVTSRVSFFRLAEDGVVSAEDGGNHSGIMLVASPESMRAPARGNFPYVLGRDRGLPLGTAASPAANPDNGSGDDKAPSRSDSVQDPENIKNHSPLLSSRHRRTISTYSRDVDNDDSPTSLTGSSLFGPGGLLAPRRVRLLLLVQCLVVVSARAKRCVCNPKCVAFARFFAGVQPSSVNACLVQWRGPGVPCG